MEQYFQNPAVGNNTSQDGISMVKWKSLSADGSADGISGGLDCNICLDLVRDPVVTFCGHLYCWPCIYKWLHFQTNPSQDPPQCPVCKAPLSEETLIPLYGRGLSTNPSEEKARQLGIVIPQRPLSPKCSPSSASPSPTITRAVPQLQQFGYLQQQPQFHNGPALSNSSHPTIEMLGEMVLARMFGYETGMYEYPSSYHPMGGTSPRIRRQVMQADKSLSRIINFLFCCMFLCLLLF